MTIHKRRGSGYWWYYLAFAVGIVGLAFVFAVVSGGGGGFGVDWTRVVKSALTLTIIGGLLLWIRRR